MRWFKNNIAYLLIFMGIIGFVFFNYLSHPSEGIQMNERPTSLETVLNKSQLKAEVKGEVNKPGIYLFEEGDRVIDLIKLAGGITRDGDIMSINQSQRLVDEMVIVIPKKENDGVPDQIFRYIQVEIKGQVKNPGVYKMKEKSILYDLILEAGGLREHASTTHINLAEKLIDESVYVVESSPSTLIYVEIKGAVSNPGVYEMNLGDLLVDLIDKAGGMLDSAYDKEINLVEPLINYQTIEIPFKDEFLSKKAVEIKGEVNQPGVYYFYKSLRMIELIQMAGGFNEYANYDNLNLSEYINDETLIVIPKKDDLNQYAVDLKGQVKYPGVYYVSQGKRLIDVIQLAGGFRPEADTSSINLSQVVDDEMVYNIPKIDDQKEYIYVEIKGEICLPGIYSLEPGDRLIMLINRAGGFTNKAYTEQLNLTRVLEDEEVIEIINIDDLIYVSVGGAVFDPGIYKVKKGISMIEIIGLAGGLTTSADIGAINFNDLISESSQILIPSIEDIPVEIPIEPNGLVNINKASSEELQTLQGIGVILAERIITYRETEGFFNSTEDIMNVSGIKDVIYESIKDDITV